MKGFLQFVLKTFSNLLFVYRLIKVLTLNLYFRILIFKSDYY